MTSEHERTAAMLNEVFDFDPPMLAEDLRWYYDDNPAGAAAVGRVERDGQRLGNYALIPLTLQRGDGHRVTVGVGVDLAVRPEARGAGTFRATVEDSYARGAAAGLDGILGIANANSAPRMVSALGWRALPDLPARLLTPAVRGGRFTTVAVTPEVLQARAFDELVGAGFAPPSTHEFAPVWTPELLRWRLAKRRARYWLHVDGTLLAVSTVTRIKGIPFAVLLKTLRRTGGTATESESAAPPAADGGALVRHLIRAHRTPFVVHFGAADGVTLRGITLPRRYLPSPLALVLHGFGDRLDEAAFALGALEFLDFDAY